MKMLDGLKIKKKLMKILKIYSFQTVDARSRERFEGKVDEPRPGLKKGCIIGSKNIPFKELYRYEIKHF